MSNLLPTEDVESQLQPLDRLLHATVGRVTGSISPSSLMLAYADWLIHFQQSPAKWAQLLVKARRKCLRHCLYAMQTALSGETVPCIEPLPQDHRFRAPSGNSGPSTSTTRVSCSHSSGGTTRQLGCVASPGITNRSLNSVRDNYWTSSHRQIVHC